jgi:hypothetical protein
MKKSKYIQLVILTAAISACTQKEEQGKQVFMRADSTANYSHVHSVGNGMGYFCAFHAYGMYRNGVYHRAGFYSSSISERANIGSNGYKGTISRGGFGSSSFSVSS